MKMIAFVCSASKKKKQKPKFEVLKLTMSGSVSGGMMFQWSRNNNFPHTKSFEVPPVGLISGVQFENEPHVFKSLSPAPLLFVYFLFIIGLHC